MIVRCQLIIDNAPKVATKPQPMLTKRAQKRSWLEMRGFTRSRKSLIVLVVRELMPEEMLDIVAAKMPAMTRPRKPAGRMLTVK